MKRGRWPACSTITSCASTEWSSTASCSRSRWNTSTAPACGAASTAGAASGRARPWLIARGSSAAARPRSARAHWSTSSSVSASRSPMRCMPRIAPASSTAAGRFWPWQQCGSRGRAPVFWPDRGGAGPGRQCAAVLVVRHVDRVRPGPGWRDRGGHRLGGWQWHGPTADPGSSARRESQEAMMVAGQRAPQGTRHPMRTRNKVATTGTAARDRAGRWCA